MSSLATDKQCKSSRAMKDCRVQWTLCMHSKRLTNAGWQASKPAHKRKEEQRICHMEASCSCISSCNSSCNSTPLAQRAASKRSLSRLEAMLLAQMTKTARLDLRHLERSITVSIILLEITTRRQEKTPIYSPGASIFLKSIRYPFWRQFRSSALTTQSCAMDRCGVADQ